jgi:hypothetical protein
MRTRFSHPQGLPGSGDALRPCFPWVGLLLLAVSLHAAPPPDIALSGEKITWNSWQPVRGIEDISRNGSPVRAYSFGTHPGPIEIGGVKFLPFASQKSDMAPGFTDASSEHGSSSGSFAKLPPAYRDLLKGALVAQSGKASLKLTGLRPGQWYEIQLWSNDSRPEACGLSQRVSGSPFLHFHPGGAADKPARDGNPGTTVTGMFLAEGSSQTLDFTAAAPAGGSPRCLINALQLRAIPAPDPLLVAYKQRRQYVLNSYIDGKARASFLFTNVSLDFATGQIDKARASSLEASRWMKSKGYTFDLWPAVDMCIRWKPYLHAETRENIRGRLKTINYRTPGTANLSMLAWVIRFLGSEEFGEDSFEHPKNDRKPDDPNTRNTLRDRFMDQAKDGCREFASSDYGWLNILPMLTVAQLAKDPEMKRTAEVSFTACMAQLAPVWQKEGYIGIWSSRNYEDQAGHLGSLGRYLWLCFGSGPRFREDYKECKEMGLFAAMDYTPPLALLHAATERDSLYFSRSRGDGFQSAYVWKDEFILFSHQDNRAAGSGWCSGYGVRWKGMKNFLSLVKPSAGDQKKLRAAANHGKMGLDFATLQHRDAVLFSFDISHPYSRDPRHAMGQIPGGHLALFNDAATEGRIFLHYGPVMIALSSDVKFQWDPAKPPLTARNKPLPGDSQIHIASPTAASPSPTDNRFAMAMEVAHPTEFPAATPQAQLAAFRTLIRAKTKVSHTPGTTPTIGRYITRRGDVLIKQAPDPKRNNMPASINGTAVDYKNWPMLENPWMKQDARGGPLTINGGGHRTILDFRDWTMKDTAAKATR